jgi:hypothetical protein
MNLEINTTRPTYQRSGRVAWPRFLPAALATLLVADGMAWCWFLARIHGWDYWLVTGAALALPVALAGYLAVVWGHCRNRWVAGALGLLAAVVYYAGYYHADFVHQFGPAMLTRLDLLPEFIQVRMILDALVMGRWILPPQGLSWLLAVIQLAAAFGIIGGIAIARSRRAYCEHCRRWMRSIPLHSDPGKSAEIAEALEGGDLAAIPVTVGRIGVLGRPVSLLEFEYCPGLQEPDSPCAAYLTLQEVTNPKKRPEVLMYQGQLRPDEREALAVRLPVLAWLRVSAPPPANEQELFGQSLARHTGPVAAIERLPPDAGTRQFDRVAKVVFFLGLVCVAVLLAGVGLTVWGALRTPWQQPPAAAWADWVLLGVGLVLALAGGFVCWVNVDYPGVLYARRWIRGVIAARPDALVGADDPAAHFVDVVPRAQWHRLNPAKPTDLGLLLIDRTSRRLAFEGMKERYVIPADAVLACAVEPMRPHTREWNIFAMVLTVRPRDGAAPSLIGGYRDDSWEIPFVCLPTAFRRFSSAYRRALAESLRSEIENFFSEKTGKIA